MEVCQLGLFCNCFGFRLSARSKSIFMTATRPFLCVAGSSSCCLALAVCVQLPRCSRSMFYSESRRQSISHLRILRVSSMPPPSTWGSMQTCSAWRGANLQTPWCRAATRIMTPMRIALPLPRPVGCSPFSENPIGTQLHDERTFIV